MHPRDWGTPLIIGVAGSPIAGILINLIMGDGFEIRPGGVIGSIACACLILWIYTWAHNRGHQQPAGRAAAAGDEASPAGGERRRSCRWQAKEGGDDLHRGHGGGLARL